MGKRAPSGKNDSITRSAVPVRLFRCMLLAFAAILTAMWTTPSGGRAFDARYSIISFSESGRYMAIAADGQVLLADLGTGTLQPAWQAHHDIITTLAFAPGNEFLATASLDGTLAKWSIPEGERLSLLKAPTVVNDLVALPAGGWLAGGWDGSLFIWDLSTGQQRPLDGRHLFGRVVVDVAPGGRRAVSAGDDQTIRLWDLQSGRMTKILADGRYGLKADLAMIRGIAIVGNGEQVLAASVAPKCEHDSRTLHLWNLSDWRRSFDLMGRCGASGLSASRDRRLFAFIDRDRRQGIVMEAGSWTRRRVFDVPENVTLTLSSGSTVLELSPNGRLVASLVNSTGRDIRLDFFRTGDAMRLAAVAIDLLRDTWRITLPDGRTEELKHAAMTGMRRAPSRSLLLADALDGEIVER